MNANAQLSMTPIYILIVVGLVGFSMLMSRKGKHRTGMGWWIGLAVILFVVSGFFSIRSLRSNSEERYRDGTYVYQIKEQVQGALSQAKESLEEGMEGLKENLEEAKRALTNAGRTGKKGNTVVVNTNAPPAPKVPRTPYSTTLELKDRDRSAKKEQVEQRLREKAVNYVRQWVSDRMPIRHYGYLNINERWLQDNGAFPEPVEYTEEEIARLNTSSTDRLYGGTLKLLLSSNVQEQLIDQGYSSLQYYLEENKFTTQWIITIVLCGVTGLFALFGIIRGAVRGLGIKMPSPPVTYVLPWMAVTCGWMRK
jgi:hypothetical protein